MDVTGTTECVKVFDMKGSFLRKFGSKGRGEREFESACFLAYEDSHLYIADCFNSRIQIWSVDGVFKTSFPLSFQPRAVAIWNHVLFISNSGGDSVHAYSKEGKELNKWGSSGSTHGQFNRPTGMCCDHKNLYVADRVNDRIEVFDEKGKWVRSIGEVGQLRYPWSVSVSENHVYVGDEESSVKVYKKSGELVRAVGKRGSGKGEIGGRDDWVAVFGLLVCGEGGGKLYVSDTWNNRVQLWEGE